ncbi:IS3 family transposase [Koleobacter methoxysyntrophicus]
MDKRKNYTAEFKTKVVLEILKEEKTVSQISSEYGIHPTQLHRWKQQFLENMTSAFSRGETEADKLKKKYESEREELLKEIGQLTVEVNWLKKKLGSKHSKSERKAMVEKDSKEITVKRQCELLDINRTSIYYTPVPISPEEIEIKHKIDEIYTRWPTYGYRRITAMLKRYGYEINRKRVRRYMREMGIYGICPGPNLSKRNKQHHTYPYLLRNLPIERPNQVFGIDITYIRMKHGWMYLVALIDWHSRYIVSWELSQTLEKSFVLTAVRKGLITGKPEIINSDQGSHFTCNDYIDLLKENNIKISMDGKGRATDNAITERFFRSLKYEKIYRMEYETPRQVRQGITEYIDEYNYERPHQSLGYKTPAEVYFGEIGGKKLFQESS